MNTIEKTEQVTPNQQPTVNSDDLIIELGKMTVDKIGKDKIINQLVVKIKDLENQLNMIQTSTQKRIQELEEKNKKLDTILEKYATQLDLTKEKPKTIKRKKSS